MSKRSLLLLALLVLAACGGRDTRDLQQQLVEIAGRPGGEIEPLPRFESYEAFTYAAASMRSPFDPPVTASAGRDGPVPDQVEPDLERVREPLEAFAFGELQMVGTLSRGNMLVALVRDGDGVVHRVMPGQYMGRNHGRVDIVSANTIELTEIVPSGDGGWIERPRTLRMSQ